MAKRKTRAKPSKPKAKAKPGRPGTLRPVRIEKIRLDGGTQMRVHLDEATVEEYAQKYRDGVDLPPPVLYHDGSNYWPADGYHRTLGKRRTGAATILCEVRPGERRDAVLHAAGANAEHGLRRTNADKRQAAETLLRDPEWSKWSDREIARRISVTPTFVGTVRAELAAAADNSASVHGGQMRTVERNGRTYQLDASAIGKGKPSAAAAEAPAEPADDVGEPDSVDRLVQLTGGTKAAAQVSSVDQPDDYAPPVPKPPVVRHEPSAEAKAAGDLAAALDRWAVQVRDLVYELVQQDETGCRLAAMIGLELGDVGQAITAWECAAAEAKRIVLNLHADQVSEAINCDGLKPGPLIKRLLGDRAGQVLGFFADDADLKTLAVLFEQLASGWGAAVPREPTAEDFLPKAERGSVSRVWVDRMAACETANAARTLFHEHEQFVNAVQLEIGQTPTVGRIKPLYSRGFSTVKSAEWAKVIAAAKKLNKDKAAELQSLVDQGIEIHGAPWKKLYEAEINRTIAGDDEADEPEEIGPAETRLSTTPPPVKGKPSDYQERVLATVRRLVAGGNGLADEEHIVADMRSSCSTTQPKVVHTSLMRLVKKGLLTRSMAGYYRLPEGTGDGQDQDQQVLHVRRGDDGDGVAGVQGGRNRKVLGDASQWAGTFADGQPDSRAGQGEAGTPSRADGAALLPIPDKAPGQSLTWYQWAQSTTGSCQTLGLNVEQILPTDYAVGLYRAGLKPKQAAKRYAEQHTVEPGVARP